MKKEKQLEILAPAGTFEICKAVINAGADAVYLGGKLFGARAYAGNLSKEEIIKALRFAHLRNANIYMTVNTLLKESEINQIIDYLRPFYEEGLDGAIVQDFGVMHLIREHFPDLYVHASTQMSVMGSDFAGILKKEGVKRIVLPREFTLEEAKSVYDKTGIELEAFVHGALCYCYSGQCLFSSMRGDRSGNRGTCAQPCRLEFKSNSQKGRFLCAKDIAAIEALPEIVNAGIFSLKIEGRMKNVTYAAGVTQIYRKYADLFLSGATYKIDSKDITTLLDLYNRGGFSKGFFSEKKGPFFISMDRANHKGTKALEVIKNNSGTINFKALEDINAGDVFETAQGKSFTSGKDLKINETFTVNLPQSLKLEKGKILYRTKNAAISDEILKNYVKKEKRMPIKLEFICRIGEKASLRATDCSSGESVIFNGTEVQKAKTEAISEADIKIRLEKLGNTPFFASETKIICDREIFISNGCLNEIRRETIELLTEKIREKRRRKYQGFDYTKKNDIIPWDFPNNPIYTASVFTEAQLKEVLCCTSISRIYISYHLLSDKQVISLLKNYEKEIYIALPFAVTENKVKLFEGFLKNLSLNVSGFLIRNFESIGIIKRLSQQNLILLPAGVVADSSIYGWNTEARGFIYDELKNTGFKRISHTLPAELSACELEALRDGKESELVIYGRTAVMKSLHCLKKNIDRCDPQKSFTVTSFSDDRERQYKAINFCDYCNNVIFDAEPLSLFDQKLERVGAASMRLDFTIESSDETKRILNTLSSSKLKELGHKGRFLSGVK